jgi:hypothetical protein
LDPDSVAQMTHFSKKKIKIAGDICIFFNHFQVLQVPKDDRCVILRRKQIKK